MWVGCELAAPKSPILFLQGPLPSWWEGHFTAPDEQGLNCFFQFLSWKAGGEAVGIRSILWGLLILGVIWPKSRTVSEWSTGCYGQTMNRGTLHQELMMCCVVSNITTIIIYIIIYNIYIKYTCKLCPNVKIFIILTLSHHKQKFWYKLREELGVKSRLLVRFTHLSS